VTKTIEDHRAIWAKVAKANGWYQEPFYVQVWRNGEGEITDSISSRILTTDVIVEDNGADCDACGEEWDIKNLTEDQVSGLYFCPECKE
jgi:hypothetical protein